MATITISSFGGRSPRIRKNVSQAANSSPLNGLTTFGKLPTISSRINTIAMAMIIQICLVVFVPALFSIILSQKPGWPISHNGGKKISITLARMIGFIRMRGQYRHILVHRNSVVSKDTQLASRLVLEEALLAEEAAGAVEEEGDCQVAAPGAVLSEQECWFERMDDHTPE